MIVRREEDKIDFACYLMGEEEEDMPEKEGIDLN